MKIWISYYQLLAAHLNPKIQKNKYRKGALLRVRFEDGLTGYSDLCPFPEMGDHPLEIEVRNLLTQKPTALGARTLENARWDAEMRAQNKSIYAAKQKIKNHFLIVDLLAFDLDRVSSIESTGYSEFKIKIGRELVKETVALEHLTNRFAVGSKVRLDFNSVLSRDRFVDWIEKNQKWLRPFLEYIEDPFVYQAKEWREVSSRWNIPFALDQAADPIKTNAEGASVVVIKPCKQSSEKIIRHFDGKNKKFVFTHYMDFPVGQMFACAEAQRWAPVLKQQLLTCGLQAQELYKGLTFQDQIQNDGPFLIPPEGLGVGFDRLLENQDWIELN